MSAFWTIPISPPSDVRRLALHTSVLLHCLCSSRSECCPSQTLSRTLITLLAQVLSNDYSDEFIGTTHAVYTASSSFSKLYLVRIYMANCDLSSMNCRNLVRLLQRCQPGVHCARDAKLCSCFCKLRWNSGLVKSTQRQR